MPRRKQNYPKRLKSSRCKTNNSEQSSDSGGDNSDTLTSGDEADDEGGLNDDDADVSNAESKTKSDISDMTVSSKQTEDKKSTDRQTGHMETDEARKAKTVPRIHSPPLASLKLPLSNYFISSSDQPLDLSKKSAKAAHRTESSKGLSNGHSAFPSSLQSLQLRFGGDFPIDAPKKPSSSIPLQSSIVHGKAFLRPPLAAPATSNHVSDINHTKARIASLTKSEKDHRTSSPLDKCELSDSDDVDHGGSKYTTHRCSCQKTFSTLYAMSVHLQDTGHMPKMTKSQSVMDYPKLVRGQDMWLNQESEQTRRILRCMQCGESFKSLPMLTVHMMQTQHYTKIVSSDHGRRSHKCSAYCEKELDRECIFKCKVCHDTFTDMEGLANHMIMSGHHKKQLIQAGSYAATEFGIRSRRKRYYCDDATTTTVASLLDFKRKCLSFGSTNGFSDAVTGKVDGVITCENCTQKIDMEMFVDHVRVCLKQKSDVIDALKHKLTVDESARFRHKSDSRLKHENSKMKPEYSRNRHHLHSPLIKQGLQRPFSPREQAKKDAIRALKKLHRIKKEHLLNGKDVYEIMENMYKKTFDDIKDEKQAESNIVSDRDRMSLPQQVKATKISSSLKLSSLFPERVRSGECSEQLKGVSDGVLKQSRVSHSLCHTINHEKSSASGESEKLSEKYLGGKEISLQSNVSTATTNESSSKKSSSQMLDVVVKKEVTEDSSNSNNSSSIKQRCDEKQIDDSKCHNSDDCKVNDDCGDKSLNHSDSLTNHLGDTSLKEMVTGDNTEGNVSEKCDKSESRCDCNENVKSGDSSISHDSVKSQTNHNTDSHSDCENIHCSSPQCSDKQRYSTGSVDQENKCSVPDTLTQQQSDHVTKSDSKPDNFCPDFKLEKCTSPDCESGQVSTHDLESGKNTEIKNEVKKCTSPDCESGQMTKTDCELGQVTKTDCELGQVTKTDCELGQVSKTDCELGQITKTDNESVESVKSETDKLVKLKDVFNKTEDDKGESKEGLNSGNRSLHFVFRKHHNTHDSDLKNMIHDRTDSDNKHSDMDRIRQKDEELLPRKPMDIIDPDSTDVAESSSSALKAMESFIQRSFMSTFDHHRKNIVSMMSPVSKSCVPLQSTASSSSSSSTTTNTETSLNYFSKFRKCFSFDEGVKKAVLENGADREKSTDTKVKGSCHQLPATSKSETKDEQSPLPVKSEKNSPSPPPLSKPDDEESLVNKYLCVDGQGVASKGSALDSLSSFVYGQPLTSEHPLDSLQKLLTRTEIPQMLKSDCVLPLCPSPDVRPLNLSLKPADCDDDDDVDDDVDDDGGHHQRHHHHQLDDSLEEAAEGAGSEGDLVEYKCAACSRQFASKGSYRYHLSRCHLSSVKMYGIKEAFNMSPYVYLPLDHTAKFSKYYEMAQELANKGK